ncbi:MAG: hypothetical protein ACOYIF_06200 [Acetivibrionales bacterium]|jgi:hypothetical protein
MRKDKKERIKTRILIILIITCVIQIGIHWNMQTQGLPFHFISQIFARNGRTANLDVDKLKNRYFTPGSIIVSISTSHWRLDERDSQFKKTWEDIRDNYLPSIIKQKPDKILPKEQWSDITGGRCIRVDFDIPWPSNIIYWLTDIKPSDVKGFDGIKSIVIAPQLDVNQTVNIVFIYDKNQIYRYKVNINSEFLPKRHYSNLADELSSKNKPSLRLLSSVSNFTSDEDILVALTEGKGSAFSRITTGIPEQIVLNRTNMENYNIQDNILLDQKESLSANYTDSSEFVMFTDTENLYRLYKDGVLEYNYVPAAASNQDDISAAFKHAITFIEQRRHLVGDADIVLKSIDKESGYYRMEFEYKFEGVPVHYIHTKEAGISHPLTIKANADRILECRWVIRYFIKYDKPSYYSVNFANLLNKQIVSTYPEILESNEKFFKRIEPGYVFELSDSEDEPLPPNWIISTDSRDYFIPLLRKGG